MYCPKCRAEFYPNYTECPGCGVSLVEKLAPEPIAEYADWQTVLVGPDEYALMIAGSRLEAEGIKCFTTTEPRNYYGGGTFGGYAFLGTQELQVAAQDFEKAREILDAVNAVEDPENEE